MWTNNQIQYIQCYVLEKIDHGQVCFKAKYFLNKPKWSQVMILRDHSMIMFAMSAHISWFALIMIGFQLWIMTAIAKESSIKHILQVGEAP